MQAEKSKSYLTPKQKEEKISNFLKRMEYFGGMKEEKIRIKQRLK